MSVPTLKEQALRRVVETDRFDDADWETVQRDMPKLEAASEQLADVSWTGPSLLGDVHAVLHKARPSLKEQVDPKLGPNREVIREVLEGQAVRDLRQYTIGDPYTAGLATSTMADQLGGLLTKMQPAQDAADEADEAQKRLDEFENGCIERWPGGTGGRPGDIPVPGGDGSGPAVDGTGPAGAGQGGQAQGPGPDAEEMLDRLRKRAEETRRKADEVLDDLKPRIGADIRRATAQAAAEAADAAEAAAGWGIEPGVLSRTDPTERVRLAKLIASDRLRRIAEIVGRMRNMIWGEQSVRFDPGPDEVHDVVMSADLSRIVPTELVNLTEPDLNDLFWLRYAEGRLLTYELRSTRREAKGAIVLIEDNSLSMRGEREEWARSAGLALLDVAVRQNRRFTAIVFSGPGSYVTYDFDPATRDTNKMLDYASLTIHGGTEFQGPLDAALAMLDDEVATTGRSEADIVFATDGECKVTDEWMANWEAARTRLGFTCYGLNIGGEAGGTLDEICAGRVAEVHRLVDGNDTRDIFRSISKDHRS